MIDFVNDMYAENGNDDYKGYKEINCGNWYYAVFGNKDSGVIQRAKMIMSDDVWWNDVFDIIMFE